MDDKHRIRTTARWSPPQDTGRCAVEIAHAPSLDLRAARPGACSQPCPDDLLDAALAASAVMRMARFLRRGAIPVESLRVEVSHAPMPRKLLFTLSIHIVGSLTELQRQAVLRVANANAIQKALMCDIRVVTLESLRPAG